MALIKCPKCGKEISDKAKKCVGCGWEVNLSVLNKENDFSNSKLDVIDSKIDMSHIKNERKKMLKEAELEIEKMKENARQEMKLMHESAEIAATQKQKELELEYKKREEELARQKASLERSQKELERAKKEQSSELQYTMTTEKKTVLPSVNIIFMLIPIVFMVCFMIIVWRRLDKFSTEIDFLVSNNNQINSQLPSNVLDEKLESTDEREDISNSDLENGVDEIIDNKETKIVSTNDEKAIAPDKNIASIENSSIGFEYTGNEVKYGRLYIYIKITNTGEMPIFLTSQRFHYLNDVSIEKDYSQLDTEILSGKSSLLEIRFDIDKVKATGVSTIDSFTYQYNTSTDADSEDLIPGEVTFDNLGIEY